MNYDGFGHAKVVLRGSCEPARLPKLAVCAEEQGTDNSMNIFSLVETTIIWQKIFMR